MADSQSFGRRSGGPQAGRPASLGLEAPRRRPQGGGPNRLTWIGEVVCFVGLVLAMLASIGWPSTPEKPDGLGGMIYLSRTFQILFSFDDPAPVSETVSVGGTIIDFSNPALLLAFLLGMIAIWGRRWTLVALVIALFLFPWDRFGYPVYGAIDALVAFLIFILFRLLPWGRWVLLIALPVIFVGGLLLKPVTNEISTALVRVETARYLRISFDRLQQNKLQGSEANGGRRISTLVDLPAEGPIQTAAKAYAVAQELALSGDPAGAAASLQSATESGFTPNAFDRNRMDVIERYAAASDAFGPEERDKVRAEHLISLLTAWAALGTGLILMVGGFLVATNRAGVTSNGEAGSEWSNEPENTPSGVEATSGASIASQIRSMSGREDGAVVSATRRRIAVCRAALAGLGTAALLALTGYFVFRLPNAASNTAFADIALTYDSSTVLRDAGIAIAEQTMTESLVSSAIFGLCFGVPLIIFLLLLRYGRLAIVAAVLVVLATTASVVLVDGRRPDTTATLAIGPDARKTLEAAVANPDRPIHGSGTDAILNPRATTKMDEASRLFPGLALINPEAANARLKELQGMLELTTGSSDTSSIESVGALTPDASMPTFSELKATKPFAADFSEGLERARQKGAFGPPSVKGGQQIKRVDAGQTRRSETGSTGDSAASPSQLRAPTPQLGGAHAAYTLAQLAYLEGRPGDAKAFLERIKDRYSLGYYGHLQRLELIRDWAAANGAPVSAASSVGEAPPVMAEVRSLANILFAGAIAAAGLALLPLGIWLNAARRRPT